MVKNLPAFLLMLFIISSCTSSKNTFVPKSNDIFELDGNNNEISILSYNIQTVLGMGSVKTKGLIDYLNKSKFNLIAFQEVFDESVREMLVSGLDDNHYSSIVARVDYETFPSNLNQDAGLFMASSLPQIDLSQYEFDDETKHSFGAIHKMLQKNFSVSMDFLANKSVVGSLHILDDSTRIFLFTTHLQAVSSKFHRTYQLEQIHSFIAKSVSRVIKYKLVNDSENLAVILTGDLNYNAYNEKDYETLSTNLGNPVDLHAEFHGDNQEYTMMSRTFGFYSRLDYVFAYDNLGLIKLRKVRAKNINVFNVVDSTQSSISDHFAIKAILDYQTHN